MADNDYHVITRWRVAGTLDEVWSVLGDDPEAFPRWWPAVYLDVRTIAPGGADGVGRELDLFTKGWLPYTLRWRCRVTATRKPFGYSVQALGDLAGEGHWTFRQDGDAVDVAYDWRILADKPLLRRLSFVLKPLFRANHVWAMDRGEESLALELARRRARSAEERGRVPGPPGPTFVRRIAAAGS